MFYQQCTQVKKEGQTCPEFIRHHLKITVIVYVVKDSVAELNYLFFLFITVDILYYQAITVNVEVKLLFSELVFIPALDCI